MYRKVTNIYGECHVAGEGGGGVGVNVCIGSRTIENVGLISPK